MTDKEIAPMTLDKVLSAASLDKEFRELFIENPREVLDRLGIEFAPGYKIMVVEVPEDTVTIGLWPLITEGS